MRYLLGTLLFTTALFAAESRFSEAEAKFNREYDAAKAVFDRAVKVAQDKLVVAYNEEMKRLTAKGDLDGAVALRDKIKNLEPEKAVVKRPEVEIIGKWDITIGSNKGVWEFSKDNIVVGNSGTIVGTWRTTDDSIIVEWGTPKRWETFKFPLTGEVHGESWTRGKLTAKKIND